METTNNTTVTTVLPHRRYNSTLYRATAQYRKAMEGEIWLGADNGLYKGPSSRDVFIYEPVPPVMRSYSYEDRAKLRTMWVTGKDSAGMTEYPIAGVWPDGVKVNNQWYSWIEFDELYVNADGTPLEVPVI